MQDREERGIASKLPPRLTERGIVMRINRLHAVGTAGVRLTRRGFGGPRFRPEQFDYRFGKRGYKELKRRGIRGVTPDERLFPERTELTHFRIQVVESHVKN